MTAIAADRDSKIRASARRRITYDVAAATKLYAGTMVCLDASGDAVAATATAVGHCVGVATEQVDNSAGSAGDLTITVETGVHFFTNDTNAVADTDNGMLCAVKDNQTVQQTDDGAVIAGIVDEVVTGGVYVYIPGIPLAYQVIPGATSLEAVSAPGGCDPDVFLTRLSVDGTDAFTMADGTRPGQLKLIRCIAAANTPQGTLTPTTLNDGTTLYFDAVGEEVLLMWQASGGWTILLINGCTLG